MKRLGSRFLLLMALAGISAPAGTVQAQRESNVISAVAHAVRYMPEPQALYIEDLPPHPGPRTLFGKPYCATGDVLCESIADGCLERNTPTRVLNFPLYTVNVGQGLLTYPGGTPTVDRLEVPNPPAPPPFGTCPVNGGTDKIWTWSCSHHHFHLRDWGSYRLIRADTQAHVLDGTKFTFLVRSIEVGWHQNRFFLAEWDVSMFDPYAPPLPCQYLRIAGIPDGEYNLVAEVNLRGVVPEGRVWDNASAVRIRITGNDDDPATPPPSVVGLPPSWSAANVTLAAAGAGASPAAVVSKQSNNFDLFYVGTDGQLYTRTQDPTSGLWTPAAPAAISNASRPPYALQGQPAAYFRNRDKVEPPAEDTLDVFARSPTGRLYWFFRAMNNPWDYFDFSPPSTSWTAASPPAAASSDANRGMVAVIGGDGAFWYRFTAGFSWGPWASLGGSFASDAPPALLPSGSKMFHAFARKPDGTVSYNRFEHGTGWSGWQSLGGSVVGGLAAASQHIGRVDLFARGSDNQLQQLTLIAPPAVPPATLVWNAGPWTNDDGIAGLSSSPVAISTGNVTLDVFYFRTGASAGLRRRHFDLAVGWSPEENLGTTLGATTVVPLAAGSWADRTLNLFLRATDGSIVTRSLR